MQGQGVGIQERQEEVQLRVDDGWKKKRGEVGRGWERTGDERMREKKRTQWRSVEGQGARWKEGGYEGVEGEWRIKEVKEQRRIREGRVEGEKGGLIRSEDPGSAPHRGPAVRGPAEASPRQPPEHTQAPSWILSDWERWITERENKALHYTHIKSCVELKKTCTGAVCCHWEIIKSWWQVAECGFSSALEFQWISVASGYRRLVLLCFSETWWYASFIWLFSHWKSMTDVSECS